jgi:hypothetical protein
MQRDKSFLLVGMTWVTRREEHEFDDLGRNVGEKVNRSCLVNYYRGAVEIEVLIYKRTSKEV